MRFLLARVSLFVIVILLCIRPIWLFGLYLVSVISCVNVACPYLVTMHSWTCGVPADTALHLMVNNHEGRKPSADWIRPPGRPYRTWLNLVQEDANIILLATLWRAEIARRHHGVWRRVSHYVEASPSFLSHRLS